LASRPPKRTARKQRQPKKRARAAKSDTPALLREYSAKRAFEATPEPAPQLPSSATGPLLFVVQQHSATRLHYDFRLEVDGVLKSWAVPKGPSLDPNDRRLAVQTEDHPYDYGSFEGVIPPGQYGAGEVIVWDCGVFSPDEEEPIVKGSLKKSPSPLAGEGQGQGRGGPYTTQAGVKRPSRTFWDFHNRERAQQRIRDGLEKGKLSFTLCGEKLKGSFALVRSSDKKNWFLIKHKDRFVTAPYDINEHNLSVLSGMQVEDLTRRPVRRMPASRLVPTGEVEPLPDKLAPMMAELGDAPFNDPGWMWEPKLDGYRVLILIDEKGVRFHSRRGGMNLTAAFPSLIAEITQQSVPGTILDAEIVAFDISGRPSFPVLQNRALLKTEKEIAVADKSVPIVLFCFDMLQFAGINLRDMPYADRRRYLSQCLLPTARVQLVHSVADGLALHEAALANGFEGTIGKRKDSRYEPGRRTNAWLKIKSTHSSEFVVGGYTKGRGSRESLGALLLGYWNEGKLQYCGHVGSGLDDAGLDTFKKRIEKLRTGTCPFTERPELHRPTTWLKPELVAEVKFQNWTPDGNLRAPVFLRLRDDIESKEVRRASMKTTPAPTPARVDTPVDDGLRQLDDRRNAFTIAVGSDLIKLTHLDRVYWPADKALKQPALTKRDLLRYLARVSPMMLPHLADRPLTGIRMPEGIGGERFFQKHWDKQSPPEFADQVRVFSEHKDEEHDYLICNNLATLLWLGQHGTLEFHVWHSRAKLGADAKSKSTDYDGSTEALEASVLNYPDYVVFDIDPYIYSGHEPKGAEPELNTVAFEKGKEVALRLRELLQGMGLEPVVKTSGKTGLHVFVPIERTLTFDEARQVSEMVGRYLLRLYPKDITMEWSVPKRTGKIFIDYNMNVRGKTLNVAYSPRGVPGAPVSMPLTWEELAKAHPLDFTITNAPDRLAKLGDRWRQALTRKHSIERALDKTPG